MKDMADNPNLPFIWHPQQKHLPADDNLIVHLDSHPSLLTLDKVNWILPAAAAGFISTLVWVRPPWSTKIPDGSYVFTIGIDLETGNIGVNSNLPIFVSNCLYVTPDKLNNKREISLEIVTVGKEKNKDDFNLFVKRIKNKFPEGNHYILDIDLDFFSTVNPYSNLLNSVGLYELLLELYWFGINENMSQAELEEFTEVRKKQLNDLSLLWEHAATCGLDGKHPESEMWDEFKGIAKQILDEKPNLDWGLIHAAGCSWDEQGNPLVEHVSSREEISTLINVTLNHLLDALPKQPSVITIYEVEHFCPSLDVSFIHNELIGLLNSKYHVKITEHEII